ncbi:MAG: Dolichyl-phosphate-mannose-protein mannosyltransferase [Verrucomicrobiota bacterium]
MSFRVGAALILLGAAWLRLRHIAVADAFVDESALILTAIDSGVRELMQPWAQGRPALLWLFAPAGWFPGHELVVARMMSAGAGVASLVAVGWSLRQLAGRMTALIGMGLWALMPFAVFHERLALQDPFTTALLAWAVALMIRGSSSESKGVGYWFVGSGVLFGIACLNKISAVLALPWLGLLYIGIQVHYSRPVFSRKLGGIALGAAVPLLLLLPTFVGLGSRNAELEFLPSVSAGNYWTTALRRSKLWWGWYAGYGGWVLAWLALGGLWLAARARARVALLACAGVLVSLLVATLVHNRPYARYVLQDQVPLVLFLALAWGQALIYPARLRALAAASLALAVVWWGSVSLQIGTDPRLAAVPADEIEQYYTGHWSGSGLDGVGRFLTDYADEHKVTCVVLTHRYFRSGAYGLLLAAVADSRLAVLPNTINDPEKLAFMRASVGAAMGARPFALFILYEGDMYTAPSWVDAEGSPVKQVCSVARESGDKFTLYKCVR